MKDAGTEVMPYCTPDDPCAEGYYCQKEPCEATIGICVPVPRSCEGEPGGPVCGCNGTTYENECEMQMAQQSKKHDGPCEAAVCLEGDSSPCGPGEFCEGGGGLCGTGAEGWCETIPPACDIEIDPVCGCNDVEYSNDCHRQRAGVWLKHHGSCLEIFCDMETPCSEPYFCEFFLGACPETGAGDIGTCTDPEDCFGLLETEVCGCDGITYSTDCRRRNAGVSAMCLGPCPCL